MIFQTENLQLLVPSKRRRGFTLVELLVVVGIIIVLVGLTMPALKSLSKSNDQSQATNLVRSMISTARSIAISQHRQAGVVFFEESSKFSSPVNSSQTAMQIFVEDFDQTSVLAGQTRYTYYSRERQYLPAGVRVAALTDNLDPASGNVEAGFSTSPARAILFDASGQLLLRSGLSTYLTNGPANGAYPVAFGDWNFLGYSTGNLPSLVPGKAFSSPGFFLYDKNEYDAQPNANKLAWIKKNATVVIVNSNTGGVIR